MISRVVPVLGIQSDPQLVSAGLGMSRAAGSRSSKQVSLDLITFDQFRFLNEGFFVRFLKTYMASRP